MTRHSSTPRVSVHLNGSVKSEELPGKEYFKIENKINTLNSLFQRKKVLEQFYTLYSSPFTLHNRSAERLPPRSLY